jgi:aryl-alcohol dehydrogenase-like predicted oxidoreductase
MKFSGKLGLGTVQFGLPYGISNQSGQTSAKEVQNILNSAQSYGVDLLDSASAYGNAEEVLGQNDLSGFKVVSKFMPPSEGNGLSDQLRQSMKNFKTTSFHGYLAHRPMDVLNHPEQWAELQEFKAEGKVKKVGFSLNDPYELKLLLEEGYKPDLVQVPFNYFDRRFEPNIKHLKKMRCEIHTRSAFLQGLFFMDPNELPVFFDEVKDPLKQLQKIKLLNGALLNFVLDKPFIDKVIIGVESKAQLLENLESIEHALALPELNDNLSDNVLNPSRWPKS